MERRKGLGRGKPLDRGNGPARKTPLGQGGNGLQRKATMRGTGPSDRVPAPRRPSVTGPGKAQRDALLDAHKGRCVICGCHLDGPYSDHHRTGRGMGGRQGDARADSNLPGRRLPLCGSGTTGCHGWVTNPPRDVPREHLEACGWVVRRSHADPASVPVWSWRGWLRCTDDGTVTVLRDGEAPEPPPQPWRPA